MERRKGGSNEEEGKVSMKEKERKERRKRVKGEGVKL